jgi:hypothetical protein
VGAAALGTGTEGVAEPSEIEATEVLGVADALSSGIDATEVLGDAGDALVNLGELLGEPPASNWLLMASKFLPEKVRETTVLRSLTEEL